MRAGQGCPAHGIAHTRRAYPPAARVAHQANLGEIDLLVERAAAVAFSPPVSADGAGRAGRAAGSARDRCGRPGAAVTPRFALIETTM